MDRMQELNDILNEPVPAVLEHSVKRARARYNKSKIGRWCGIPVASLAGAAAAFVLLVNTSVPFARACGSIPFLKEFAAAVAFSPSLKAAVENDYVQIIGQEQTVNGVTMKVEYLIVDQKQVNIFFSLKSPDYSALRGDPTVLDPDGKRPDGCSVSWRSARADTDLQCITLDFLDESTPPALTLNFKAVGNKGYDDTAAMSAAPTAVPGAPVEREERTYVAEFSFDLRFDPAFTQTGETLELNAPFTLDGQRFTAETVEVYPTHVRLNLSADSANTAALKGLAFYLEDEKGNRYGPISDGITATGSSDTPGIVSYRLESSYFDRAEHLTIHITGATWLDQDREYVTLDLAKGIALDPLPEGVQVGAIARRQGNADIVLFGLEPERNDEHHMVSYQLSGTVYKDPEGGEHYINFVSSSHGDETFLPSGELLAVPEGYFTEEFTLFDCPWDTVELKMCFSRRMVFETPISLNVK